MSVPVLGRLLIANRGEIACRILRTTRRLGLSAIAVYSDADADARHVRLADEAYRLGPSPAAQSYLDIDRVLEVALRARADAVHPGYGFLSENAEFAARCTDAGLVFVGPPAAAIRAMGSKSEAKLAMMAAKVPVVPGYQGAEQTLERLRAEALAIGFPLIVKASAGGGGKGMQVVWGEPQLPAALESARRLALGAFGDGRLLIERYFVRARHVEVQVFADAHGGVVTLFDRDCSVQRRHQKIIEEAPAPGLAADVRAAMAAAAISAARAVGYVGAGTVEFLVDASQEFYFLEMNTRLQVEHPVTELVAGLDLVEWQIRVARGEPLPPLPARADAHGVAVEARLYAEDPARGYLPSVGRIEHLQWPPEAADLRIDCGVDAGDVLSSFYDPLLAKIIAWGESRAAAIARLQGALHALELVGVDTNQALLVSVLADAEFRRGPVSTDYLQRRAEDLVRAPPEPGTAELALAAVWCAAAAAHPGALWSGSTGWRLGLPARTVWRFAAAHVVVEAESEDSYAVSVGEGAQRLSVHVHHRDARQLEADLDGRRRRIRLWARGEQLILCSATGPWPLRLARTEDTLQGAVGVDPGSLSAPLPGTLVAVHVSAGQRVARGAALATIEAMKMEHTLTAPHDGVVERIVCAVGERVAAGALLVEMSAPAGVPDAG